MASLSTIRIGDLIEADIRGSHIIGEVTDKGRGHVVIRPVGRKERATFTLNSERHVKSRQILTHWRKTKNVKKRGGQTTDE
jgi:hypothetical protein